MSNKIKSLLYFTCLVASCFIYYQMELETEVPKQMVQKELNDIETENVSEVEMASFDHFN